ncbi:hypothetical protein [Pseudomonas syringae]|uniref:hypothetical protein n=1 Tax=Pseudomonas syringae TaxID=317 RepID=UPI000EFF0173|nr:hypothetical protein [Pseudomonas azotoformans]
MLERNVEIKFLVIDGPFKGQRMAQPGEQFTFEVSSVRTKTKIKVTYFLRCHRLLGLVWALPANKSVSNLQAPKNRPDDDQRHVVI